MAKQYSKELEDLIISQYNNGVSPYKMVKTIPELYNKRPSVIYGVLKRKGIKSHNEYPLTEEQRYPERNTNNYQLTIGGNRQVKKILNSLYSNADIYLERKYNRYKQLLSSMVNATEDHGE